MWLSVVCVLVAIYLTTVDRDVVAAWAKCLGRVTWYVVSAPFRLVGWAGERLDRALARIWPLPAAAPAPRPVIVNVATGETRPLTVVSSLPPAREPELAHEDLRARDKRLAAARAAAIADLQGKEEVSPGETLYDLPAPTEAQLAELAGHRENARQAFREECREARRAYRQGRKARRAGNRPSFLD